MRRNKLTHIILSLLLCAITMMTACIGGNDSTSQGGQVDINTTGVNYEGTHIYNAEDTACDLVKNGQSEYKLVVPVERTSYLDTAKNEFVYLFQKATGVRLSVVYDDGNMTHNVNAKYISIGETGMLKSAGISYDKTELKKDGHRIETKDKTVYIVGGGDSGSLYGVYTFMQITFNFEQYTVDCYEIDKMSDVKLKDYQVTDIPDLPVRRAGMDIFHKTGKAYMTYDEQNAASRMKMKTGAGGKEDLFMPVATNGDTSSGKGNPYHNEFNYLPKEIWEKEPLPEELWEDETDESKTYGDYMYSDSKKFLCYTAHGNEKVLDAMVERCAWVVQQCMTYWNPTDYPDYVAITLTENDGGTGFCQCQSCLALETSYGNMNIGVIRFVNRVSAIVYEWMNKPENAAYKRDNFSIMFFAYEGRSVAPVKYNETKQMYEPIDETVALHPFTGVFYAEIKNGYYTESFNSERNKKVIENMKGWGDLTDNIIIWTYETNYGYFLFPHDTFDWFSGDANALMASLGYTCHYNQNQSRQQGKATAWHELKQYLDAKLMWDSSLNEQELIDAYFEAMFKEGAFLMRKYYDSQRTWCKYIYEKYNITNYTANVAIKTYWPYTVLTGWENLCNEALVAVEHYKTADPALYQSLKNHIEAEWVCPVYMKLLLWDGGYLTDTERPALIARFEEVTQRIGMTHLNQGARIETFIDTLK